MSHTQRLSLRISALLAEIIVLFLFFNIANVEDPDDPEAPATSPLNIPNYVVGAFIETTIAFTFFYLTSFWFRRVLQIGSPKRNGSQEDRALPQGVWQCLYCHASECRPSCTCNSTIRRVFTLPFSITGEEDVWHLICRQSNRPLASEGGWRAWEHPICLNDSYKQEFVSDNMRTPASFVDAEGSITCKGTK